MKKFCETEKQKNSANLLKETLEPPQHLPVSKSSKARAFKPIEPMEIDGGFAGEIRGRKAPCSLNETNKENM